jgi:hypothetical protein
MLALERTRKVPLELTEFHPCSGNQTGFQMSISSIEITLVSVWSLSIPFFSFESNLFR